MGLARLTITHTTNNLLATQLERAGAQADLVCHAIGKSCNNGKFCGDVADSDAAVHKSSDPVLHREPCEGSRYRRARGILPLHLHVSSLTCVAALLAAPWWRHALKSKLWQTRQKTPKAGACEHWHVQAATSSLWLGGPRSARGTCARPVRQEAVGGTTTRSSTATPSSAPSSAADCARF